MRERRGRIAEWIAAAFLCLKGYRILARRYRSKLGEIDLIAVRGRRLAFVEVKRRKLNINECRVKKKVVSQNLCLKFNGRHLGVSHPGIFLPFIHTKI